MNVQHKARLHLTSNTLLAFATPIHQRRYTGVDAFNAEVRDKVLALKTKSVGLKVSNVGGWHSESDLLQKLGDPHGQRLAHMFVECVKAAFESMVEPTASFPAEHSMEAWANVNTKGDSNAAHIHPGCPWSGVYYVATDAPGPGVGGEIEFTDPRAAALMSTHPLNPFNTTNQIRLAPVPGLMVVFPSFLYHGVLPYNGDSPRISIAFNLH